MKLPKARGSGRQVGAGQFGEVDPDLGPDLGLPFDLQAARQPGGAWTKWAPAVAGVDGLSNAANGQQGPPRRRCAGKPGDRADGRRGVAVRRGPRKGRGDTTEWSGWGPSGLNAGTGFWPLYRRPRKVGPYPPVAALAEDFAAEVGAFRREASSPDMVAPGRRSPSSGGSPRVRFPGQENQYQPAGTVGRAPVGRGRVGARRPGSMPGSARRLPRPIRRTPERGGRRPPPGRGGGLSVSHQVAADAGEHRRGWISATAGANPEAGSIEGRSDVYRMAGGRKPSFKAPFSSANRPDCVRPRSEVEDHEGENGKQLASLRLLSLGLPVVWAKKVLDISGKIFDHLPMMDSVIRLFNRSYKNHFITFDNNYGRVEL